MIYWLCYGTVVMLGITLMYLAFTGLIDEFRHIRNHKNDWNHFESQFDGPSEPNESDD